jgi:hypothetical protein
MAKAQLNSGLNQLNGMIDGWVYKQTPHGTTVSRRPDKPRDWSEAQQANRIRMKQGARQFYWAQMSDSVRAAHYRARALELKIPVSSFLMGGFMKHGARFAEMEKPVPPRGRDEAGRDGGDAD